MKNKKRFEVREMDIKTIEKLNKIRKLLNLSQSKTLEKIINDYYERNKNKLIKQFLNE